MATNLDDRVETTSYSMTNLGEFTDDKLVEITELSVLNGRRKGEPIPDNKPLSPRIGSCRNLTTLSVANCSFITPEISNCTLLEVLNLCSHPGNDDDDCRIELPEGIVLPNLILFCIKGGGNWNADEIISWVASCSPNLRQLSFHDLTKDTAKQFMRLLQNNEAFIEKFEYTLLGITFNNCSLNEDDALMIYAIIKPLYPRLGVIDLQNNTIESIETIGRAVRETPPANNNPLRICLCCFFLNGNPFVRNLNDPDSPDSVAMICLLKYHQLLYEIGDSNDNNFMYSPIINYWLMMNESELRYMLDDGHGGTRLSVLPYVMHNVYNQRKQDPTTIFTFLREGPIFRTHMQYNNDDNDEDNDDDDNSTFNNALHSRTAIFITIVVTLMAMTMTWQRY